MNASYSAWPRFDLRDTFERSFEHSFERGNGPHFELFWIPFFEFHEVCWICFGCWAAKASLVFTSDTVLSACA